MNATARATIPLRAISIIQAEGLTTSLKSGAHSTWASANAMLRDIMAKAPTDGSYHKTDVVIVWEDGSEVRVQEDVANDGRYKADLATSIRATWLFYSGLRKPDHMSDEQYGKICSDITRRDKAIEHLKRYSLDDSTTSKKSDPHAPLKHVKADVEKALLEIATLLKRVEDPDMRQVMDAASIRTYSLELRKSLAALMRIRDMP